MPRRPPTDPAARERLYQTRALGGLAASVLVVLAAFRLWPAAPGPTLADFERVERPREQVDIELIEPTVQRETAPPAPPPPPQDVALPPVEVPDERVVEERVAVIDLPALEPTVNAPPAPPSAPPAPPGPPQPEEGPAPLVERPSRSPVPVRFSEPAYPPEARREGIRARVRVRVLVDDRGRVEEARIVERVMLGRGDREELVPSLPYGMDEAALDAARRYQFRPAQDDGRRVRSYTMITCSFGV
ncbi:MAG TPA: TonB family protein [Rubricoccaceae bacterium]|nr:TonB family protein [Rubricoccaceae bacterium]